MRLILQTETRIVMQGETKGEEFFLLSHQVINDDLQIFQMQQKPELWPLSLNFPPHNIIKKRPKNCNVDAHITLTKVSCFSLDSYSVYFEIVLNSCQLHRAF